MPVVRRLLYPWAFITAAMSELRDFPGIWHEQLRSARIKINVQSSMRDAQTLTEIGWAQSGKIAHKALYRPPSSCPIRIISALGPFAIGMMSDLALGGYK